MHFCSDPQGYSPQQAVCLSFWYRFHFLHWAETPKSPIRNWLKNPPNIPSSGLWEIFSEAAFFKPVPVSKCIYSAVLPREKLSESSRGSSDYAPGRDCSRLPVDLKPSYGRRTGKGSQKFSIRIYYFQKEDSHGLQR